MKTSQTLVAASHPVVAASHPLVAASRRFIAVSPRFAVIPVVLVLGLEVGGCSLLGQSVLPPDTAVTSPPDGGGVAPGEPQPQFVVPKPGQQMVHSVGIDKLTPAVNGRSVLVRVDWVSGVEPCNVLDHVDVALDGTTYTITLFEGTSDPNGVCIEIAAFKATLVSLGDLEPGTYTVRAAQGDAPPVTFTVS